jgi:hypothetical protein
LHHLKEVEEVIKLVGRRPVQEHGAQGCQLMGILNRGRHSNGTLKMRRQKI